MGKIKTIEAGARIENWADGLKQQAAQAIREENRLAATLIHMAFPYIASPEKPDILSIDQIATRIGQVSQDNKTWFEFIDKTPVKTELPKTSGTIPGVMSKTQEGHPRVIGLDLLAHAPEIYEWLGKVVQARVDEANRMGAELPGLLEELGKVPDIRIDGNTVQVIRTNRQPEIT